jgi:hypothetical protein
MSEVLEFFPTQDVTGNSGASATYYSPIFDVTEFASIEVELRAYVFSGTGTVDAKGGECIDPCLNDGSFSESFAGLLVSASGTADQETYDNPLRFLRIRLVVSAGIQATIAVRGVARRP